MGGQLTNTVEETETAVDLARGASWANRRALSGDLAHEGNGGGGEGEDLDHFDGIWLMMIYMLNKL